MLYMHCSKLIKGNSSFRKNHICLYKSLHSNSDRKKLPKRDEMFSDLKRTAMFDVLVIGGGATGSGISMYNKHQPRSKKVYI
jgi:alkyl hydroperoxide reductase subunit AhpF